MSSQRIAEIIDHAHDSINNGTNVNLSIRTIQAVLDSKFVLASDIETVLDTLLNQLVSL